MNKKPNIILMLADDLDYGDVKCYNPNLKIETHHMDQMATHTGSAVCTPARYAILTGRYCRRSRLKKGVLLGYDPDLIEPDRMTLPKMLKQNAVIQAVSESGT